MSRLREFRGGNWTQLWLVLFALIVLCPNHLFALFQPNQPSVKSDFSTDRIVVKLKAQPLVKTAEGESFKATGIGSFDAVNREHSVTTLEALQRPGIKPTEGAPLKNVVVVTVPEGGNLDALLADYRKLDIVEYAQPDWPAELYDAPDDPLYEQQWPLNNTGQGCYHVIRLEGYDNDTLGVVYGTPDADIDQLEVFENPPDATTTVVVAMIDTGVDLDHPDLADHIWTNPNEIPGNHIDDDRNGYVDDYYGWDFCGNSAAPPQTPDNDPTDGYGHGTHCAGTITAVANNGLGIAGIVQDCKIMALKFHPVMLSSYAAAAITYAADNGADVISMSWGYPWPVQILEDALAYARQKGVVLVAAAGNDFIEYNNYPAAYDGIITVSASTRDDQIAEFSTFGNHVEVCAPGYGVLSLRADDFDMYGPSEADVHIIDEHYYLASGTSMACPHVAGVAAYLRAVSPGLTPDATQAVLQSTADDIVDPYGLGWDYPGWDKYSGSGRVNLQAALAAAPQLSARITSPHHNSLLSGSVTISGHAEGAEFSEYTLEYGLGESPSSWTTIESSTSPVSGGTLGEWNTDGLDGVYTLRLSVGSTNVSFVNVYVANSTQLAINSPADDETIISAADILGTASCPDFSYALLQYGVGTSPYFWYQIAELAVPAFDGHLATWNTGTLTDGLYSLRLSLYNAGGLVDADTIVVHLESPFSAGHGWRYNCSEELTIAPNYGDFDNDGEYEIAVGTGSGLIWLNPDGTLKTSGMPDTPAHNFRLPIAVGDLDDDDIDDWVAVGYHGVYGTLYGFPSGAPSFAVSVPAPHVTTTTSSFVASPYLFLSDIDGDGRDEIHYSQGYTYPFDELDRWHVYNSDGSLRVDMFLIDVLAYPYQPADLDGDGIAELYQASDRLYQYDNEGNLLQTVFFPDLGNGDFRAKSLSAVDLNGDGTLYLQVFGDEDGDFGKHWTLLYDANLDLIENGVHANRIDTYLDPSPPIWGDVDGDGSLEYFLQIYELSQSEVYAFHADGNSYSSDSLMPLFAAPADPAILYGGVIGDISGDGLPDVIACEHPDVFHTNPVERLDAWDLNGQRITGFPYLTVSNTQPYSPSRISHPIVGDLDKDGTTDLTFCTISNQVVFTNIEGVQYVRWANPTPMFRYDRRMDNIFRGFATGEYVCGDADFDGLANISDAVFIIAYIFSGGPAPHPYEAGDVNCDGMVNVTDAVYLVQYIFVGGNPPCDTDGDGTPDC